MKRDELEKIKNEKIDVSEFEFTSDATIHDAKFDTKPIGYFHDAFNRFKKNKGSIFAAGIIVLLLLYAVLVSLFSQYSVSYSDAYFRMTLPKLAISDVTGVDFWDGCEQKEQSESTFNYYYAMGIETGHNAVKNQKYTIVDGTDGGGNAVRYYRYRQDSYHVNGVVFMDVSVAEFENMQAYQNETGNQMLYPITIRRERPSAVQDSNNANYWYKTYSKSGNTFPALDEEGNFVPIYVAYTGSDNYNSLRIEGNETPLYNYGLKNQTGYQVRVNYYEYFKYYHSFVLKDGISEPCFVFGTTGFGQDIFTCLASGALFSFLLAVIVCAVNFTIGGIYGAIEGYYGGKLDLVMERVSDILSAVPFMIVITLLKLHMGSASNIWALLITFFITGWIGMAGSMRMQFYRFKNQEYVLAARTLGARDRRIMFKHILPNALGTLITGSILSIPGVIFTESSLSYLGIINLSTGSITSVGTLLSSAANSNWTAAPHMMLFPCIFISLLMLSFNLFGNGLRDAFNPSLRGADD